MLLYFNYVDNTPHPPFLGEIEYSPLERGAGGGVPSDT